MIVRAVALTLSLSLAALARPAAGAVPGTLGYQGRLYDASGVPIEGTLQMQLAIYDTAAGGAPLWSETQPVLFTNGYFAVQLGAVNGALAGAFDGSVRYLGISVDGDPEMSPRAALTSVPHALRAAYADSAANASYATQAGSAQTANTATSASYASSANVASSCTSATNATYATRAGTADTFGKDNTGFAEGMDPAECTIGEARLYVGSVGQGLRADGRVLNISQYQVLYSLFGARYGGNGTTTFALPNLTAAAPNGSAYFICTNGYYPQRY